jgi:hypothetical protein
VSNPANPFRSHLTEATIDQITQTHFLKIAGVLVTIPPGTGTSNDTDRSGLKIGRTIDKQSHAIVRIQRQEGRKSGAAAASAAQR